MQKWIRFLAVLLFVSTAGCPLSSDPAISVPAPSGETESLDQIVARTLRDNLTNRTLSTDKHGAWQILHGILAYGDQFTIQTADGSQPAIEYVTSGGRVDGFEPLPGDAFGDPPRLGLRMEMQPSTKVGQGHRDQWLAVLAQTGLAIDTAIDSANGTFTIADWVRQTEYDIPRNLEREFSWTLIALTSYRETTHNWDARNGGRYSIEDLLASELDQSIAEGACGGTHRLIGISMSLNRRRAERAPISGVWSEAETALSRAIELAQQNQNPDGSYSVAYLSRPGWTRDLGETLGTTGHVLEFLSFAASDETLQEPWVKRSVRRLCQVLDECKEVDLECGVLYHALHGLAVYQNRIRRIAATNES